MVVEFWLFAIAVCAVAFAAYYIGYRACNNQWQDEWSDKVSDMVGEKIEQVRQLYDETYRNVVRELVEVVKKEVENNGNQK